MQADEQHEFTSSRRTFLKATALVPLGISALLAGCTVPSIVPPAANQAAPSITTEALIDATVRRQEVHLIGGHPFFSSGLIAADSGATLVSGQIEQGSPTRESYFTVESCAAQSQPAQPTAVKDGEEVLATLAWTNPTDERVSLGLMTGYDPPNALPAGWEPFAMTFYLSMASRRYPGVGSTGLDEQRLTAWPAAVLTIDFAAVQAAEHEHAAQTATLREYAPAEVKLFFYGHQHTAAHHGQMEPVADEITNALWDGDQIVIGGAGQSLPLGLYLIARPTTRAGA